MTEYAPGMRVLIRDEEWMVKKVETNSDGGYTLFVVGVSPLVKDFDARFLADLDKPDIIDPAKVKIISDDSPGFVKSKLYLESQLRQRTPTDEKLHIGTKAAMDSLPYQLEPSRLALSKPRQRILIADTVGLGKTLEAGILISELIARGKGKRILVATVKSMMTQFQQELWNRFTIPLVRLDSNRIQRIRQEMPSNYNPFVYYDKTIVSIDTLKRDIEYRTHLENAWWDIIVIDEAHNVADRGQHAQRAKLAKLLAERSDTLIMLTATPHDGRAESFASLLNMLDPTAIPNPTEYTQDDIKELCIRRFKKDVQDQLGDTYQRRIVKAEECPATSLEEKAFSVFVDMKLNMDAKRNRDSSERKGKGILLKTSFEKAMFSSPAACIKSVSERLKKLSNKLAVSSGEEKKGIQEDINALKGFSEALAKVDKVNFSRYQRLLSLLNSREYGWKKDVKDDRVVIFTERIETMKFLAASLRADLHLSEEEVREMSGSMTDAEQQDLVGRFGRKEDPVKILVASDVASEGINLHYFCHRLIHFDIPWSLMVYQQRNGRIDRYGQKVRPDIRYMRISSNTAKIKGDTRILEILVAKENQACENIGDVADIMGQYSEEGETAMVGNAIESGMTAESFERTLKIGQSGGFLTKIKTIKPTANKMADFVSNENNIFTDYDYLKTAANYLSSNSTSGECYEISEKSNKVLELKLSGSLLKRCKRVLPAEALPEDDTMSFCANKEICLKEIERSRQSNLDENTWPKVQYLWAMNPIFGWLNDKISILYNRDEVPLLNLPEKLADDETIIVISATIPNKKSTPVIYEWFGVQFINDKATEILDGERLMSKLKLSDSLPNYKLNFSEIIKNRNNLLPKAIEKAKTFMSMKCQEYKTKTYPLMEQKREKLEKLEELRTQYVQTELYEHNRLKREEELKITKSTFEKYKEWETNTIEVEDKPYFKVMAVITGVRQ